MSNAQTRQTLVIWYWLMALVILSVGASFVLPKAEALMLIFAVALIKALLVARNYMHLKHEKAIIYAIALVPLAFVIIFLIGVFPDFVYHPTKP
ncbi:MAG TPA: cytochrome C oxidase subunit IV family protein [Candidatus Binatia bacterium]|nr:cytochrome C oxidase subunit IV family protein [Candidatus Binatia bacterium]